MVTAQANNLPHQWMRPVDLLALVHRQPLPAPFDPVATVLATCQAALEASGGDAQQYERNMLSHLQGLRESLGAWSLDELAAVDAVLADWMEDIEVQLPAATESVDPFRHGVPAVALIDADNDPFEPGQACGEVEIDADEAARLQAMSTEDLSRYLDAVASHQAA